MSKSAQTKALPENLAPFSELFVGFDDNEIDTVCSFLNLVNLRPDQYLFHEETSGENLYFLLEGQVQVEKGGHLLTTLNAGTYFGEISVLDGKPRSATIHATRACKLYALNTNKLHQMHPPIYSKLVVNLAKLLPELVRKTSAAATTSLSTEVTLLKQQNDMGHFLSYIMVILATFIIIGRYAQEFDSVVHTAIYVRFTLVLCFALCVLAIRNKQPFSTLGVNLDKPRTTLQEAALYSVAVIILSIAVKYVWIRLNPGPDEALFRFTQQPPGKEFFTVLAYCIYSPLQEFVARGCIQTAFAQFFKDRFATVRAIILSNILFCSFYVNLSLASVVLLFALGLGWGWLYNRNSSLLGVSLSHAILTIWFGLVLGLPVVLR